MLYEDEEILASISQSRMAHVVSPDSIFVTNHRIILYSPHALGLRNSIEDYRYKDMANFKVERGIIFSTIKIKQRFMSNDLILDNLPKGSVDKISRLVHDGIRRYGSGEKTGSTTPSPVIEFQNDDPLKVLKLRYAKGEISTEEFAEKKRLLE